MADAVFILGARIQERPNAEREIILSKPSGIAWRAGLPGLLDQQLSTTALVDYVVKLYFRQMPFEARLTGWDTLAETVRMALVQANGEEWEYGVEVGRKKV